MAAVFERLRDVVDERPDADPDLALLAGPARTALCAHITRLVSANSIAWRTDEREWRVSEGDIGERWIRTTPLLREVDYWVALHETVHILFQLETALSDGISTNFSSELRVWQITPALPSSPRHLRHGTRWKGHSSRETRRLRPALPRACTSLRRRPILPSFSSLSPNLAGRTARRPGASPRCAPQSLPTPRPRAVVLMLGGARSPADRRGSRGRELRLAVVDDRHPPVVAGEHERARKVALDTEVD